LTRKVAAEPGPWRTDRVPFMREPMEMLSVTSSVQDVVIMAGTQVSKTEVGLNWLGYIVAHVPGPFLLVQPTLGLANRWSRQRFSEMIDAVPVLKDKVADKRSRNSSNTLLEKEFEGGTLVVATGANSAVGLRSMPARYIHFDEVDGYPHDVDGEGDPIGLARNRQDTFGLRAKRLYTSTPTEKDVSVIAALYERSDQRQYHVACPHCGHEQVLRWSDSDGRQRLVPIDGDAQACGYICEACAVLIEEHNKFAMLATGRWIAQAPGERRAAGYWLNSLYSPWMRWSSLLEEFVEASATAKNGDFSQLKKFMNTRAAVVWEQPGDSIKAHALKERVEPYQLGSIPPGGLVITAAVDVQDDRLEFKAVAWGMGEEAWIVDFKVIYGNPADDDTWVELVELLRQPMRNAWGHDLWIRATAIDSGGHHTQRVYAFCRDYKHLNVYAIKGVGEAAKPVLGKRSSVDFNYRGIQVKQGAYLYPVGTFAAKEQLAGWLRLNGRGAHRVHFSKDLGDEYFSQLTAERLVTRWVGGKAKREWWKPKSARNEALDLMVYNMAAAWIVGLPRWRASKWEELQRTLESPDLFRQAPTEHAIAQAHSLQELPPAQPAAQQPIEAPASSGASRFPARRVAQSSYLRRR